MRASATPAGADGASPWARLRALLIAVALLVQCTSALPDRKLERRHFERPEMQRFVGGVERALGAVGLSPGRRALERALRKGSVYLVRSRGAVLRPFEPLFRVTGTRQQWGLFLLGTRECFRAQVQARDARGGWVELYRAPGQGVPWLQRLLRYRRLRGIYNPSSRSGPHEQYAGFVHALARQVFAREPHWLVLRVRMERLHIGEPGTSPESRGFEHEIVELRPWVTR